MFAGLGCTPGEPAGAPPSILLVVLDTVRADRTSTFGHHRPTTPQLDAVARAGVAFDDVTAPAPWTWPSHASLFTGEPPWVHGAKLAAGNGSGPEGQPVTALRDDLPTLAERLGTAGYRTVSLAANAWLRPELGLIRGFEEARQLDSDAEVVAAALAELARPGDRPVFLFVNLMAAHTPYREGPGPWAVADPALLDPRTAPEWARPYLTEDAPRGIDLARQPNDAPPSGVTRFLRGELEIPAEGRALLGELYDAGVRGADFAFGRILGEWTARHPGGVVCVTSDHGEALGDHGHLQHMALLYPELLRVPLVLAAPGRLPAGARVAAPVELLDLHATLLELAGVERSPRSLLRHLEGDVEPRPVVAAAEPAAEWSERVGGRYRHGWRLYREGEWSLLLSRAGEVELYRVASDPVMERDLAEAEPARVAALRARAEAFFAARPAARTGRVEIPGELREQLEALGYAGGG